MGGAGSGRRPNFFTPTRLNIAQPTKEDPIEFPNLSGTESELRRIGQYDEGGGLTASDFATSGGATISFGSHVDDTSIHVEASALATSGAVVMEEVGSFTQPKTYANTVSGAVVQANKFAGSGVSAFATSGAATVSLGSHTGDSGIHTSSGAIAMVFDGGGSALASGSQLDILVPWNATIDSATILPDQSGSVVIDVWKDTFANYPPTVADNITAGGLTLASGSSVQDTTLTGWSTTVSEGDTLRFNVSGAATNITRATMELGVTLT